MLNFIQNKLLIKNPNNGEINYNFFFYLLLITHVFLWTIVPTLIRHTLPMDALEGFVWGQNWLLGYDRNPWLNAWITHFAVVLGGNSGWLVYLCSQLSVLACFLAVWSLGKKIANPAYALIAVFLLETIQYYHLASVDLNDNVLELGLWALTIVSFYDALLTQKTRYWLSVGFFAGLSLMTKYYAVVLFLPMMCIMLLTKEGRKNFKQISFYSGIIVFLIIIIPHFVWLFANDFSTMQYAVMRVSAQANWHNSGWYFAIVHILAIIPMIVLYWLFFFKNSVKTVTQNTKISSIKLNYFQKTFMLFVTIGPFVTTVVLAIIFKMTLHTMWGTPLLSFWSLLLVIYFVPSFSAKRFKKFIFIIFSVLFTIIAIYAFNIINTGYISSATYPGKQISQYVDANIEQYAIKQKPYYVIGDRYTAGNVAFFSKYPLKVCILADNLNDICNNNKIQTDGAIFVWQNNTIEKQIENKKFWYAIKKAYPHIIILPIKTFPWNYHNDKPHMIFNMAILLPEKV